jgi:His-Xaa-Ser system protein HxsD
MSADWLDVDTTNNAVAFTVDQRVYSVEAVLRTAYWFTDRAYIFISTPAEHTLRVHLKTKPVTLEAPHQESIDEIAGEFSNALLDNQLRESVEERTGKIRELLVAKAVAEAGVLADDSPPGTPNDPVADKEHANLTQITP